MAVIPVVENTNYRGRQILIGRMSDFNSDTNTLSKAVDISPFVTEFMLEDAPQTEEFESIDNGGQQSGLIVGPAKYTGSLNLKVAKELLIVLISAVYGRRETFAPKTATAWAADTVTEAGNVVEHSGGKFLVAQNDGTTGTTEPTITDQTDYDRTASDNGIFWLVRDNLFTSTNHMTGFCTDSMIIIERAGESCGSANAFDTIVTGAELTMFAINKADGVLAASEDIPYMATEGRRSSNANFVDITVTDTLPLPIRYWEQDDCTIRVDGLKYGTLKMFNLDYTRQTTTLDGTEPFEQIVNVGSPTFGGQGSVRLDPDEYERLLSVSDKEVSIVYDGGDGELATFTFPNVQFNSPQIERTGNEPFYIMFQARPTGDSVNAMATVNIETGLNWA